MKISVIVRTHNEERNLPKFVEAYHDWVDYIFVQDDNSDDRTYLLDVMRDYPKVYVHWYYGKRIKAGKITRAFHHIQLNQLIEWAEGMKSKWIIMDDCDSIPNRELRLGGRKILKSCPKDFVYITKLHFYKDKGHFPEFSAPQGHSGHCLWAWKADKGFKFIDNGNKAQRFEKIDPDRIYKIDPPFVALHHPWPNDEVIAEKRERYTAIYGDEYKNFDPLSFAGKLEEPPWYAVP